MENLTQQLYDSALEVIKEVGAITIFLIKRQFLFQLNAY